MKKFLMSIILLVLLSNVAYSGELTETLKEIPGVYVRDITGHIHEVDFRGFRNTDVLVLLNGRRTNSIDLSATEWASLDLEDIEDIELIKTYASILYGDNSTGGVINVHSKRGKESSTTISNFFGRYDYYSNSIRTQGKDYSVSYRNKREGGYRDNSKAKVQTESVFLKKNNFVLESGGYQAKYGLPGALTTSDIDIYSRRYSNTPNDEVKIEDYFVRPMFEIGGVNLSFSYRDKYYEYMSPSWDSSSNSDTLQFDIDKTFDLDINKIQLGTNIQLSESRINIPLTESNIDRDDYGFFLFNIHDLGNDLFLRHGYRFQRTNYDFDGLDKRIDTQVFSAGIFYNISETQSIHFDWGQNFRNPLTDEYYSVFSGLNKDLEDQTSDSYEIGYKFDTKNERYEVNLFHIKSENEIYYNPLLFKNSNLSETERTGIELVASKMFKKLKIFGNYTYEYTDSNGYKLQLVPENKFFLGYQVYITPKLTLSQDFNYVGSRYLLNDLNNELPKLDSYVVSDIRLIFNPNEVLNITAGISNLFDKEYSDLGVASFGQDYYYPNQDRAFYAQINLKF